MKMSSPILTLNKVPSTRFRPKGPCMKTPKLEYLHHRLADVIMGTEGSPPQGHVEPP